MSQAGTFRNPHPGQRTGRQAAGLASGAGGRRTAVVERQWVGGSCPNVACLPSKNEIWSARVAYLASHAAEFGAVNGAVTIDMSKVRQRKRAMVDREVAFHLDAYKRSGAELIMGSGRFVAPKTIEVQLNDGGKRLLASRQIVLNVGTHAAMPDIPGLAAAAAAHPHRGTGARLRAVAPGRDRRRLCRSRDGAGLSPLRQPCHGHRARPSDHQPRGCRRCRRRAGRAER